MKQNWQWTVVFITGFRMFLQTILLERHAYSACWMAPLIGMAFAYPFIILLSRHWQRKENASLRNWVRLAAAAYLLNDTAQIVLLYQEGTKFASLSSYPTAVLYLILLVFSLFVVRQGRNGVFSLGGALKFPLLVCLSLLIVFRLPDVSLIRFAPWFGGGAAELTRSGLSLAGYGFSLMVFLSAAPDYEPKTASILGMWITACAGAALFSAAEVMISPVAPGEPTGMYLAISRLLTSGRSQTSLQLVLYMVWFSLMFMSVCLNIKCIIVLLADVLRRGEGWLIQCGVLSAAMLLAILCEHMLGENLRAYLAIPGAFRGLLLPVMCLPLLKGQHRKAVAA